MKSLLTRARTPWERFWFSPLDLFPASVFRAALGLSLFCHALSRQFEFEFFFGDRGLLPFSRYYDLVPAHYVSPIPWEKIASLPFSSALHALFLVGCLALALGWIGRKGTWILFILHLAFLKRNPFMLYGADFVATHWLLYACLIQTDHYLAWKPWKKPSKNKSSSTPPASDLFSTIGIRFIQIQICIIYAYSGLEKAKGLTWWKGDALWNSLANSEMVTLDLTFIHHFTPVLAVLTFATLLWEAYFPFLVILKPTRIATLIFGLITHVSIGILFNIPYFSLFMLMSYFFLIEPETLRNAESFLHAKLIRRSRSLPA